MQLSTKDIRESCKIIKRHVLEIDFDSIISNYDHFTFFKGEHFIASVLKDNLPKRQIIFLESCIVTQHIEGK